MVGDEPLVRVELTGVRGSGKTGERVVATLLVTDIADSTAVAARRLHRLLGSFDPA